MATLYRVDGTKREVIPANGKQFTSKELHNLIGGYIEPYRLLNGKWIVMDKDGMRKGKSINGAATVILVTGTTLRDVVVGDVLVATALEIGE